MTEKGKIPWWIPLLLAGAVSAILCTAPVPLERSLGISYVGAVYGTLIGLYFLLSRGRRAALQVIGVVLASIAAWPIAFYGSVQIMGFMPGFPLLFVGGLLGGITLLTPVVLLFRPSSVSVRTALLKALLGILLSGTAGGVGWELGPVLGAAIWGLIPTTPLPQAHSYETAALFFVWQPVIALFIGWATSESRMARLQAAAGEGKTQMPHGGTGMSGRAFAGMAIACTALALTAIVPVRLRLAHRQNAVAKMHAGKPSGVDLPLPEPPNEEQALILRQIGDYVPGRAIRGRGFVSHEKGFERPASLSFDTQYARTDERVPARPPAPRRYISVSVQEYPNSAWAQYFAEYPPNRSNSFDDPKLHAVVTQFNNKVRTNQLVRAPGQTWIPLYYMWPSGTFVIEIDYYTPEENLELLHAYLGKYSSSIP